MLLRLYNQSRSFLDIIEAVDPEIETELANGDKTLSFTYRGKQSDILNEYYVQTQTDRYVVKEVRPGNEKTDYTCKLDLEDLEEKVFYQFTAVDQTISQVAALALNGTGWTVDVVRPELNLKSLNLTIDSYDYVTRLVPIGKDGLTIEDVNDGKEYVENYQYTTKIRTQIWEDTSYEDAEALKEDAEGKLEDLSKPKRSYSAQIRDLAKLSPENSAFSYSLGDVIHIVDEPMGVKEDQRIVKINEYPDNPEANKAELSNTALTWEEMQDKLQAAADAWDDISNSDGTVNGVYVHGISDGNKVIIQTEINGNTKVNQAVKSISVLYALGQSPTVAPETGWSTVAQDVTVGTYLWQKVVKEYNNGDVDDTEITLLHNAVADEAYNRVTSVYGTCSTLGATADKAVSISGFELFTGAKVSVLFQYGNAANNPTLNVSGTGAKPIAVDGSDANPTRLTATDKKNWGNYNVVEFTYDGTNWRLGDPVSLTRIDNILTNSISGTNGWINLALGTFDYGNGRLVWDGTNLSASGVINADEGYIGGWAITDEALRAQSDTTVSGTNVMWIRDGTATANQDFIAVEHHSTEPDDPDDVVSWPFWVRADGTFHAEEGNIAGWDFTSAGFAKDGNELFPGGMILANAPSGYKWLIDTNIAQGRGINFACDPNTGQYTGLIAFDENGGIWANDVVVGKCFDSSRDAGRYVQSAGSNTKRASYIGTDSSNVLLVGGQFGSSGYTDRTIVMSSSDERIKKNIVDTSERGLDFLNRIRLVGFDWKDGSGHKSIGIIADELEKLNPELVVGGGETIKAIDTLELLAYVIKAVQELSERR